MISNKFKQGNAKGLLADVNNFNDISVRIDTASTDTLRGGTAVKLVDKAGNEIFVDKAASTDSILGFVVYNSKKNEFVAGTRCNVVFDNSIMFMEAGAAIVLGAELEIVATGDKVITAVGVNAKIGYALDKSSADGDLIRVLIKTPILS